MLVLSRKKSETIVIDGQIEIEVLKIKGNTVRIGIKAPNCIKVLRGELSVLDIDRQMDRRDEDPHNLLEQDELSRLPNPFVIASAS